jgi:hypothetical protein
VPILSLRIPHGEEETDIPDSDLASLRFIDPSEREGERERERER